MGGAASWLGGLARAVRSRCASFVARFTCVTSPLGSLAPAEIDTAPRLRSGGASWLRGKSAARGRRGAVRAGFHDLLQSVSITISSPDHCASGKGPRRITNQLGNMLVLAAALPGYFVIYNGFRNAGRRRQTTVHFQAGFARAICNQKRTRPGRTSITVPNYGRNVFMFSASATRKRHRSLGWMVKSSHLLKSRAGARGAHDQHRGLL